MSRIYSRGEKMCTASLTAHDSQKIISDNHRPDPEIKTIKLLEGNTEYLCELGVGNVYFSSNQKVITIKAGKKKR